MGRRPWTHPEMRSTFTMIRGRKIYTELYTRRACYEPCSRGASIAFMGMQPTIMTLELRPHTTHAAMLAIRNDLDDAIRGRRYQP